MLPIFRHDSTFCRIAIIAILSAMAVGCGATPQVTQYQAPKDESRPERPAASTTGAASDSANAGEKVGATGADDSADTAATKGRMLAAMVPQANRIWFFKLLGADEGVAARSEAFESFVRSVEFTDGQPKWKLPEGWSEKPGSGMRFATINAAQPGLDVTVISLPAPQDVLENVNRWRGQLQTEPLSKDGLADASKELIIGGETATLVNLSGSIIAGSGGPPFMRGPMGSASAAPFAGGPGGLPPNHPPMTRPSPDASATSGPSGNPGFKFATPKGWMPGRAGGMRKLAFHVGDDDDAELTVTTLAKAGAAMLPNVNRWRGQVGLDPVDQEGLADIVSEVDVSGSPGSLIQLVGPNDKSQSMSVVMAERDNVVWFFKLMGDSATVAAETQQFNEFVESIEFPPKGE